MNKIKFLTLTALVSLSPALVSAATLSVSPLSQNLKAGDTLTVSIKLDTQGVSIDGVDVRYLTFNPSLLQVIDADTTASGVQIKAGSLMPTTLLNNVDNTQGKIGFSQVVTMGSKYKGSGVLATIQFKAQANGTTALAFGYTPQNTTDSNVAAGGKDVLNAVINGSYTITGGSAPKPPVTDTNTKPPANNPPVNTPATNTNQGSGEQSPSLLTPNLVQDSTHTSPLVLSEKKTYWQYFVEMIMEFFNNLKAKISEIFGK